ncbi:2,3-diaminopropionate biosynthesis protein SbnA [Paenibacillus sp. HJL G12]|uniref:N-(2-amino-2-carboxyethyl)-L-glutamate synthase n=1 Tax=Paenibacillus dendrobii TaxID=2691084 RepID=A0A7X3LGB5_9BACL|nr:2,3-diaminopropionate biosynthesis protein SbnA [Paenibacillus dendrobii]MWV42004.1 2,3-diaminopropionate biosynthesis protein SbnA [Paenibacillus dendrobii]
MIYSSVIDLIGRTPVVPIHKMASPDGAQVYVKLEGYNPGGSMKDRTAQNIIRHAEMCGDLKPGGVIVESSSGNLAIGLAMIACLKGYKMIAVVDPKINRVNLRILQAYGAEIQMVDKPDENGNFLSARLEIVKRISETMDNVFWPNQYNNPSNPEAHRLGTAREIFNDFGQELDWVVTPVGTAGLSTGCSLGLKELIPHIKVLAVDAVGSVIFGTPPGPRLQVGLGAAVVPGNLQRELFDQVVHVTDRDAFHTTRRLALEEGILAGGSSGAAVHAGLKLANSLPASQKVLVILPDRGERYYDTIFSDSWLQEHDIQLNQEEESDYITQIQF